MHAGINPARPLPQSIGQVNDRARTEIRRLDAHRQRLASRRLAQSTFTLQQMVDVSAAELRSAALALAAAKAEGQPPPSLDVPIIRESQELIDLGTWSVVDPEGPLWFRGYAQWQEAETTPQLFALLDVLKITRVVVGHTVTPTRRITPRFNGRVLLIDTGMLTRVYEGTPAALEITAGTLKAIYPTEEVVLTPTPATSVPQAQ
jgi:hypothetical protein